MLDSENDPIVAIATAPGRGAVGVVRATGASVAPLIAALCGRLASGGGPAGVRHLLDDQLVPRGLATQALVMTAP